MNETNLPVIGPIFTCRNSGQLNICDISVQDIKRQSLQGILVLSVKLKEIRCRFLILLIQSCSRLVISGTEHLVEVLDELSTTSVVFFRSERELECMCLYGV